MSKKRRDVEGPVHRAILNYLRLQYPDAVIHHSPNEMNIKSDPKSKAIAQNKAKALGMVPGWPDLEMLWNGRMYFFEVKSETGTLQESQEACGLRLLLAGADYGVVRSIDDVKKMMRKCVNVKREHIESGPVAQVPIIGTIS